MKLIQNYYIEDYRKYNDINFEFKTKLYECDCETEIRKLSNSLRVLHRIDCLAYPHPTDDK